MAKRKTSTTPASPAQPEASPAAGPMASIATAPRPRATPSAPAASASGGSPVASAPTPAAATAGAQPTRASGAGAPGQTRRPSHDEISRRAFEIWVAKGRPAGTDEANWDQAERELTARR